jgi:hypothetical protein
MSWSAGGSLGPTESRIVCRSDGFASFAVEKSRVDREGLANGILQGKRFLIADRGEVLRRLQCRPGTGRRRGRPLPALGTRLQRHRRTMDPSAKDEVLDRIIFFGTESLDRALASTSSFTIGSARTRDRERPDHSHRSRWGHGRTCSSSRAPRRLPPLLRPTRRLDAERRLLPRSRLLLLAPSRDGVVTFDPLHNTGIIVRRCAAPSRRNRAIPP